MYALKTTVNGLSIVQCLMDTHGLPGTPLLFKTKAEAVAAKAYLLTPVIDYVSKKFTSRWRIETFALTQCGLEGVLCAVEPDEMQAQLAANLKQRIEFFFEGYAVKFNPDLIRYFAPERFDVSRKGLQLRYLTPAKLSLTHTDDLGETTLIASYNLSFEDATTLANFRG